MIKIFAHRGYRALYPENTLLAFQKALDTGCYGIELDVQLTKDGKLVIIHDETLDRTTSGAGFLRDFTLSELRKLDAGRGEKIPTMEEYFELIHNSKIITNIEMKNSVIPYEGLEDKLIAAIRKAGVSERIILSSFKVKSVLKAKALAPDIKTAVIAGEFINPDYLSKTMAEHKIDYIHPVARLYLKSRNTPPIQNFPANVWTVNDEWEARKLAAAGVSGLFTDDPNRILYV